MTLPGFLFGMLISILLGAAFHLWRGGGLMKLVFFIGSSLVGFWLGHIFGNYFKLFFWSLGQLRLGMGLVGALLALFLANWLGHFRAVKK